MRSDRFLFHTFIGKKVSLMLNDVKSLNFSTKMYVLFEWNFIILQA